MLDWNSGQRDVGSSAMKERHGAVWRRRAGEFVKANLRLHKSVGWAFASPSIFNKTWKVTQFHSLSAAAAVHSRTDELPLFLSFFFPSSRPPRGAPASLLEGLGFFISGKRAGKDREDEWHQWPADTSRDVWLRQMSLVTLVGIPNPDARRSSSR